jgi:ankyrin repeat protein
MESARLLIDHGADVTAILVDPQRPGPPRSFTPLHLSARSGVPDKVVFLLKNKADPKVLTPLPEGANALQLAASGIRPNYKKEQEEENVRRVKMVRILQQAGLDLDLHSAIAINDLTRVGAQVEERLIWTDEKDSEGYTPLQKAVELSRPEIIEAFLAAGADVNGRGRYGHRP